MSTCVVKLSEETDESGQQRFMRMYMCWDGCREGFKYCRPLIGVDGCHLKSSTGGMLLTTISIDANDCIFPLAYAIVEGENKESWCWFLQLLKRDLEIMDETEHLYTFISDKQKGLIPVFQYVLPGVEHRFCVRHLHGNMKVAGFQGKALKDFLWACARATTLNSFTAGLRRIRELDNKAYEWLSDKSPTEWSRSHFSINCHCDMLVNNICECFNAVILDARGEPILTCLESIRKILMIRLFDQREKGSKWKTSICLRIIGKLKDIEKQAAGYTGVQCDLHKFEVRAQYGDQQEVDLEKKSCSCRKWDLTGIPCKHAVCAIWKKNGKTPVYDYVHPYYSKETYLKIYGGSINPMTGPDEWPTSDKVPPLPPVYTAKVGRPKKLRKRSTDELTKDGISVAKKHIQLHCSLCRQARHNSRKCPSNPQQKIKPRKRVIYSTNQMQGINRQSMGVAVEAI